MNKPKIGKCPVRKQKQDLPCLFTCTVNPGSHSSVYRSLMDAAKQRLSYGGLCPAIWESRLCFKQQKTVIFYHLEGLLKHKQFPALSPEFDSARLRQGLRIFTFQTSFQNHILRPTGRRVKRLYIVCRSYQKIECSKY